MMSIFSMVTEFRTETQAWLNTPKVYPNGLSATGRQRLGFLLTWLLVAPVLMAGMLAAVAWMGGVLGKQTLEMTDRFTVNAPDLRDEPVCVRDQLQAVVEGGRTIVSRDLRLARAACPDSSVRARQAQALRSGSQ